jgi:hypothetical protein
MYSVRIHIEKISLMLWSAIVLRIMCKTQSIKTSHKLEHTSTGHTLDSVLLVALREIQGWGKQGAMVFLDDKETVKLAVYRRGRFCSSIHNCRLLWKSPKMKFNTTGSFLRRPIGGRKNMHNLGASCNLNFFLNEQLVDFTQFLIFSTTSNLLHLAMMSWRACASVSWLSSLDPFVYLYIFFSLPLSS